MNCSQVMTTNPVFCQPMDPVSHAAHLMRQNDVGAIPVVSDWRGKKLVGMLTDRDLAVRVVAEALDADATTVATVMTTIVMACRANDDLSSAIKVMDVDGLQRMPIVDEEDCLVGMITETDLEASLEEQDQMPKLATQMSQAA